MLLTILWLSLLLETPAAYVVTMAIDVRLGYLGKNVQAYSVSEIFMMMVLPKGFGCCLVLEICKGIMGIRCDLLTPLYVRTYTFQ